MPCGVISSAGVKFVYDDRLLRYADNLAGVRTTMRASLVEPSDRDSTCWMVDFSPLGGDKHYVNEEGCKFGRRTDALEYEIRRLRKYMLGDLAAIMAAPE